MVNLFSLTLPVLIGIIVYLLPSPLEPTQWDNKPDRLALDGPLTPNNLLSNVEMVPMNGPESLAVGDDGLVYSGLSEGTLIQFNLETKAVKVLFHTGAFMKNLSPSDPDYSSFLQLCTSRADKEESLHDPVLESECGRILGVRHHQGKLFFMDAYHGLFSYDLTTKSVYHLVTTSTRINLLFESNDLNLTLPPKFFNDLCILPNNQGIVYTDSSYKHTRAMNRIEILDVSPRGRLFHYKFDNSVQLLASGLYFPNGVECDESIIIVAELSRFQLSYIDLNHLNDNQINDKNFPNYYTTHLPILLSNLPGVPDNIRFHDKELLIGVGTLASPVTDLLMNHIWVRHVVAKLVPMKYLTLFVPKYSLVLAVNVKNKSISKSWHDASGIYPLVSHAVIISNSNNGNIMLLGSHSNHALGIVKL